MPSRGTQGLRKKGWKRTSTGMSGLSAIAFSSRRLPMKHHGQTTSDTISMGSALMAGSLLVAGRLGRILLGGNLGIAADAGHQRAHVVRRFERGKRDRRLDRAAVRRQHG